MPTKIATFLNLAGDDGEVSKRVAEFRRGLGPMTNLTFDPQHGGKGMAHSTAKCNGKVFDVEENLTRSSVAKYLSGARVEFVLDPLDIGIGHNR